MDAVINIANIRTIRWFIVLLLLQMPEKPADRDLLSAIAARKNRSVSRGFAVESHQSGRASDYSATRGVGRGAISGCDDGKSPPTACSMRASAVLNRVTAA